MMDSPDSRSDPVGIRPRGKEKVTLVPSDKGVEPSIQDAMNLLRAALLGDGATLNGLLHAEADRGLAAMRLNVLDEAIDRSLTASDQRVKALVNALDNLAAAIQAVDYEGESGDVEELDTARAEANELLEAEYARSTLRGSSE